MVAHKSGQRGKKVLDTLKKGGARVIDCPAVKTDRDKSDFAMHEFRAARRRATPEAVRALVEAVGKDLRELSAACQQLVSDTTGVVDEALVEKYHGGKVEATGFRVADAAVAGNAGEALRLLRHAIATGVDPVPIVAVLAQQLRQLVRVGTPAGKSADVARDLGMAPWQVDKARRASGWEAEALGRSIQAVASADFEVKGGGRDPVYAVERAILTITRERAAGPFLRGGLGTLAGPGSPGAGWLPCRRSHRHTAFCGRAALAGRFALACAPRSCAHAAPPSAAQPRVPHARSRAASAAL